MEETKTDGALLKRAFMKIEELEARLKHAEHSGNEPIAVIGMGCRFPGGVRDPKTFWELLMDGRDAVGPIPGNRVATHGLQAPPPGTAGKIYVVQGGFLDDDVSLFDANFFGISRREAMGLDPQQRLVLETAWEALENAGIAPDTIAGSATGVFLGMASSDYRQLVIQERNPAEFNFYYLTGNAFSTASGRLSYFLGLHGPSLTVDTACSASLMAVHLACQGLRTRECSMALAGGVNLVLSPEDLISYCSADMLSPTGRCKSFDASADGFILSEGCGMVALKRLSDAHIDGDHIYAVIRGSAANQDGASNGLTAPNSRAQEMLIRAALQSAQAAPADIQYIEAHGSGTPLGDPIEVRALADVFGKRKDANELLLGCVKTNVGHCAAAAGIAGFMKTVLCLHHKKIPKNLHYTAPNPLVPWDDISAKVPTESLDWPLQSGKRMAGVSSFGISGTNVHVVLEEAPQAAPCEPSATFARCHALCLSAKSEAALARASDDLKQHLIADPEGLLSDIAYTLNSGRKHFPFRRFVAAKTHAGAIEAIENSGPLSGGRHAYNGRPAPVIVTFPGQGAQYPGMGFEIYKSEPAFREAFDRCAEALRPSLQADIRDLVFTPGGPESGEKLKETLYAQPAIFSTEYALARLWLARGLRPEALIGHSVGEFAAACIAGIMTLESAAGLVATRGRLMHSLPPGAMVSVRSPESVIQGLLLPGLSIAAVNSPMLCVVSGPLDVIASFSAACEAAAISVRPLNTSHAFHSAMVEPALPLFETAVRAVGLSAPSIPIISTATGARLTDSQAMDPAYWTNHMRLTVRFSDAIKRAIKEFPEAFFLEIGPRASGTVLTKQHISDPARYEATASLSESGEAQDDGQQLAVAAGRLWMRGAKLDWKSFFHGEKRKRVALPTYPFERQRYWLELSDCKAATLCAPKPRQNICKPIAEGQNALQPEVHAAVPAGGSVSERIKKIISDALGCALSDIDESATFLQLGMDSLILKQFSQHITGGFGVAITMRQLMREFATVRTLSAFIDASSPKGP
jgi:acyl transferase domain-containing protein